MEAINSENNNLIPEAREFTEKNIRPFAGEFEENESIPKNLIQQMAEKKYLSAPFPVEYGGLGLDPLTYGLLSNEIGKGCPSTRALLTVHTSLVGETILKWGTDVQKKKWLPGMAAGETLAAFGLSEPDVGTDAKSVQTTYTKKGDHYLLNGKKKWITYGNLADLFIIIASSGDEITAFLVERNFKGFSSTPIKGMLCGRAAHIAELELNNVPVPAENVLGKVGGGFSFIVNSALDHGRYSIAWAGQSLAEAALEEMVTYARTRKQFGKKLYKFQLINGILGDAATKVEAGRTLCIQAGELRKANAEAAVNKTIIAKYYTSKIAMEVASDAVQVHGGNGCSGDYPVARLFREAKMFEIIEGTSQIQQEIIARFALREYYRM